MENRGNFPSSPMSYCEVICRICHEGDSKEDLFSFCKCAGTLAKAHRSCLEKWLSTANSSACEICKFDFETSRKPRPLLDVIPCTLPLAKPFYYYFLWLLIVPSGFDTVIHHKTPTTSLEILCAFLSWHHWQSSQHIYAFLALHTTFRSSATAGKLLVLLFYLSF